MKAGHAVLYRDHIRPLLIYSPYIGSMSFWPANSTDGSPYPLMNPIRYVDCEDGGIRGQLGNLGYKLGCFV